MNGLGHTVVQGHGAEAAAYAHAVRSHLDDLGPDVVEELAGGLEADLAELAAESDAPLSQRIGDPAAYAAELRASAGLPARQARRGGVSRVLTDELAIARRQWSQTQDALAGTAWWGPVSSAVVSLRPAWWLLRAWIAYVVLAAVAGGAAVPGGPGGWLVLLTLMAVSVALGRGWFAGRPAVQWAVMAGNAIALLLLVPALEQAGEPVHAGDPVTYYDPYQAGLVLDGEPIANLFPYDAQGRPLEGVQLLDDRGRPVMTSPDIREFPTEEGWKTLVPAEGPDGHQLWNVFPLREAHSDDLGNPPRPGSPVQDAPLPQPYLQPLPGHDGRQPGTPSPTPSADATPSAVPTASAEPTPSSPSTPAPTPSASPTTP